MSANPSAPHLNRAAVGGLPPSLSKAAGEAAGSSSGSTAKPGGMKIVFNSGGGGIKRAPLPSGPVGALPESRPRASAAEGDSRPRQDDRAASSAAVAVEGPPLPRAVALPAHTVRGAAGYVWQDATLAAWDPNDFRIFVGDLGPEVTEAQLEEAFGKYGALSNARVVRDKISGKSKGYGFVGFLEPQSFLRGIREMNGKYIGSRPVKLRKSTWSDRSCEEPAQPLHKAKKSKAQHKWHR